MDAVVADRCNRKQIGKIMWKIAASLVEIVVGFPSRPFYGWVFFLVWHTNHIGVPELSRRRSADGEQFEMRACDETRSWEALRRFVDRQSSTLKYVLIGLNRIHGRLQTFWHRLRVFGETVLQRHEMNNFILYLFYIHSQCAFQSQSKNRSDVKKILHCSLSWTRCPRTSSP